LKKIVLCALLIFAWTTFAGVPEGSLVDGVRPGPDGKIDVVTMFPHQDDETIFAGGTILKLKHKNPEVRVHIVCFTLGELSAAKDRLKITPELQARIRTDELRAAATVLGADQLIQLDYHDQGLAAIGQDQLVKKCLEMMEQTGAEVVITYGPDGMSGHIDHRTLSAAVTEAFGQSRAQKLYYAALPKSLGPLYKAVNKFGYTEATLKVDVRPYKKLKKLAIYEHTTQKFFSGYLTSPNIETLYNSEWFRLEASR
jgi:LmbE family N-acetylglucosaminyl deacetylase